MRLPFIKLEGLGNCYIFAEARKSVGVSLPKLAKAISSISIGIGSDGLIIIDTGREPFRMRVFNNDGSEAKLCGNGLRQAALFLKKVKYPARKKFDIETPAGLFNTQIVSQHENHAIVTTSMGAPEFTAKSIGLNKTDQLAFDIELLINIDNTERKIKADCVCLGNRHAVIWVDNYDFDWKEIGNLISNHPDFSDGINVHFCRVLNSKRFQMKIYERGSGVTMACGSGAAACLAAGVIRNYLGKSAVAEMPGGKLKLTYDLTENQIYQEGPASIVCSGDYFH